MDKRIYVYFILIQLILIGCENSSGKQKNTLSEDITEEINIENYEWDEQLIYNPTLISHLHEKTKLFLKEWQAEENLQQILYLLNNVHHEGLNPDDYNLSEIEKLSQLILLSDSVTQSDVHDLEKLLSESFHLMTFHIATGKVETEKADPFWNADKRQFEGDYNEFQDSILNSNRILEVFRDLSPRYKEYHNLKIGLLKYLRIKENGGWEPFFTKEAKLDSGMRHPDVVLLRKRLAVRQNVDMNKQDDQLFDLSLQRSVKLFQLRNGLRPDGVVGKATIEAMNIPVEERIKTIQANLERWRWFTDDPGEQYIKVNIPNYELQFIEGEKIIFQTHAIVGQPYRRTPVFSSLLTYMVVNPQWTIPPTILRHDIIPSVLKNPDYLKRRNMRVISYMGSEINPSKIDWEKYKTERFPYMIRQAPGPSNAMGRIKFMFPNKYNVYIHDTPNHDLFGRTERNLSSGCVRINDPIDLANILIREDDEWDPNKLNSLLEDGKESVLNLSRPVKVHLLYFTAVADEFGDVSFRKDIYKRDSRLVTELTRGEMKKPEFPKN
jgi:L,D-transpeptidase YcbB